MTFAENAIRFNERLQYTGGPLPTGIRIMNPFAEFPEVSHISSAFYRKYYNDKRTRHLILGINPGRFGAGLTGIPFTDPKRLVSECSIEYTGNPTHEPSSEFIYEMIRAYGGANSFYGNFYINSICPLGFTETGLNGREKNYNYYDSRELTERVNGFIVENLHSLSQMDVYTDVCFCFGIGQNEKYLRKINGQHNFFREIVSLEHPRYIMQYQRANKDFYIEKYISAFRSVQKMKS
jgi:hypothetical protein